MKYRFGEFTLDLEASRLTGPEGEVRLRPQAFRMLEVLAGSAPRILSQEDLLDRVWGVEHLSPASVKQAVSEVRQALGDDPARPRIIETVHRRGYRFIAPVEIEEAEPAPLPPPPQEPPSPAPLDKEEISTPPPPPSSSPPRMRRAVPLALLISVLAGLTVLALLGGSLPDRLKPAAATAPRAVSPVPGRPARPAVAVLGFRNLSANPRDAWISSALGEIVGFELAAPGRLRLIPADNVARMRRELGLTGEEATPSSLPRVGRNLGTQLVVTGSYLVSRADDGEKVRIQMVVQDVQTGDTVAWARETGPREELIELATAAARGLLGSLGSLGSLDGGPGGPPPEAVALAANAESLRLLSEALGRLRVRDAVAAVPLLQKAERMDPDNPFVHDALAAAWARLGFDARAGAAAERARALAKGLPEETRLGIEARAHEMRDEWKEAAARYAELWQRFPDNIDYGLGLAAAQRLAGDTAASQETVRALRKLPAPDGEDPRIDLAEGDAAWQLGDFARARDVSESAIERAGHRGATQLVASGRLGRGWALKRLGDNEAALADFRAAHTLLQSTGDRSAAAGARVAEAAVLASQGRAAEARRAYEEAIAVLREIGDRSREAKALNNFAALLAGLGEIPRSIELLERSLAVKQEIEDLQGTATTLVNLANLLEATGDAGGARRRLEEAIGISRRLGDAHGTALALRGIARVHTREERFAEGRKALGEAVGLSRRSGDAEGLAQGAMALADLEKKARRLDEARRHYTQALEVFRRSGDTSLVAVLMVDLAEIDLEQGRLDAARAGYGRSLALAREVENPDVEAHARFGLAEIALRRGNRAAARPEYEKALALWTGLKNEEKAARTREAIARLEGRS